MSHDRFARLCRHAGESEPVGVLASGGLDSCVLVARLLEQRQSVQPLYVKSDLCWHGEEQWALSRFLKVLHQPRLSKLVTLDMPMADLYGDHWSVSCRDTPPAGSADEAVYLPGRNALLSIKAALWCQLHGIRRLALATLGTSPFADATESFFASLQPVINLPGTPPIELVTPLAGMTKHDVMRWGRDDPLQLTFSCIAPVQRRHCGLCNKCAERQLAFRAAGLDDPTVYATGAGMESTV